MTKCIGFKITGGLQSFCPVRFTCHHHEDSKIDDLMKQPKSEIHKSGCANYQAITLDKFKGGNG